MRTSTTSRNVLLSFPGSNTHAPELQRKPMNKAGSPVFRSLRTDLVLRQLRTTRNVITVARRLGVRANDVTLVVLDAFDNREAA